MQHTIQQLDKTGIQQVLNWAKAEGWNPGHEDANAFHEADPSGFLLLSVNQQPAAAISVVKYNEQRSFLGLYLCQPEYRGQGLGWAVWQAGLKHVSGTIVGLDGVLEQQANYKKSGFEFAYRNIRFQGTPKHPPTPSLNGYAIRRWAPKDKASLVALDARTTGTQRAPYISAWVTATATRQTWVLENSAGHLSGFITVRQCHEGHKIGPLVATHPDHAMALISIAVNTIQAHQITWDVPEPNEKAMQLAEALQLQPVFETARMYSGQAPDCSMQLMYGVCSLELG